MLASMPSGLKPAGTTPIFCAFLMGFIRCACPGKALWTSASKWEAIKEALKVYRAMRGINYTDYGVLLPER
ncbi:hypothetical protein KSZ_23850 [Dictyobacter formicarum]|uniref:Uncharacterized protein n=1 Tax=Dictyobacter formicarum TaxID=2778368 RepID=A0ABQ3VF68_9CHLR|nr:hypothetical protein KSZ_23850 [Dictyobacter formicarum]